MKKITIILIQVFFFIVLSLQTKAQTQIGANIVGQAMSDESGKSISMSADGSIVAIGAPNYDYNGDTDVGNVRVFQNINGNWTQLGSDINGTSAGDNFGTVINLNANGTILAIGAPESDSTAGSDTGYAKVFQYTSGSWVQLGSDFIGTAQFDATGSSVSLNASGTILAVGSLGKDFIANSTYFQNAGNVTVYEYVGSTWTKIHDVINGQANGEIYGSAVSLSDDGTVIAISAPQNGNSSFNAGTVRVFKNNGTDWIQIGTDIDGQNTEDRSGKTLSLNGDGTIVAIGSPESNVVEFRGGQVRVFEIINNVWTQIGSDINGIIEGDYIGNGLSLNNNGTILSTSSRNRNNYYGQLKIYQNISGTWTQINVDIGGDVQFGEIGYVADLSSDGSIVAFGSFGNGNGVSKVYTTGLAVWEGTTDTNVATDSNWKFDAVPTATSSILIPNGLTNYPTLTTPLTAQAVTIESGASFITNSTVTGTVQYNRKLETNNWYMLSSPVTGQDIDAFANTNNLAAGTGSNRGLATYNNSGTSWSYYQSGATTSGNFLTAKGYSMKLGASGNITFAGTMPTAPANITIDANTNAYNLVGNPFPSYIAANPSANATNNLLTVNSPAGNSDFTESTLWFWNQSNNSYDQINLASPASFIAPGQAFFVSANGTKTLDFTQEMQQHQTTDTFQKTANSRPEIQVLITDESQTRDTDIYYINGTTTGFDDGYDSSIFTGVATTFEVYTNLVTDNEGQKLGIQSLPDSNFEEMVIPLGIIAKSGSISITVNATNIPSEYKVFLEDREAGTFTQLDESTSKYDVSFPTDINSSGRFFLHTTSSKSLSTTQSELVGVSLYKTSNNDLKINGLFNENAQLSMYSVLGKEVFKTKFTGEANHTIPLSIKTKGVYIVKLQTEKGTLNKKIIIE